MSFYKLLYHIVISTKYRKPVIAENVERDVYKLIYGQLQKYKCMVHRIGGMPDHIHILTEIPPTVALSELMKILKQETSKDIKKFLPDWEGWSEGYGAFSYSHKELPSVKNYIMNQKTHHAVTPFIDEYKQWLMEMGIEPDSPYFPK
ncbi:MAG: IS200/IS605 family transposase [Muribaculaceae bacterium]|nr:IS200/IS605 family transposase [Muribaculaceae bacterium]